MTKATKGQNVDDLRDFKEQQRCSWENLRPWGSSTLLKNTSWFLVIIPLIARNAYLLPWEVKLPFSWFALWIVALLFSVGTGLFAWRCPKIIKDYRNFPEFDSSKKGFYKLNELFVDTFLAIGCKNDTCGIPKAVDRMEKLAYPHAPTGQYGNYMLIGELMDNQPYSELSFNWLYNIANRARPTTREIIYWLYVIGTMVVLYVGAENVYHVLRFAIAEHK